MSPIFLRGLRAVTREDGKVLLRVRGVDAHTIAHRFPDCRLLTLAPSGEATVVLDAADLPADCPPDRQVRMNISVITAAGVCMGAAENKGRRICAAAAHAGIEILAVSLCDLSLALALPTADADRAMNLIAEVEPLVL